MSDDDFNGLPTCRHCGQAIFFEHASDCPAIPSAGPAPIPLNAAQERAVQEWAADDRLWTTQETVEFNLRVFARVILREVNRLEPINQSASDRVEPIPDPPTPPRVSPPAQKG